jgi:hypothetical protein
MRILYLDFPRYGRHFDAVIVIYIFCRDCLPDNTPQDQNADQNNLADQKVKFKISFCKISTAWTICVDALTVQCNGTSRRFLRIFIVAGCVIFLV